MHRQCPKCLHRFLTPTMTPGRHPWACPVCAVDLLLVVNPDLSSFLMLDVTGEGRTGLTTTSHPALPPSKSSAPLSRSAVPTNSGASKPPPSRAAVPPPGLDDEPRDAWNLGEVSGRYRRRVEQASGGKSATPTSAGPVSRGPVSGGPVSAGAVKAKVDRPVRPMPVPEVLAGYRLKEKTTHNELGVVYATEEEATGRTADLLVLHQSVLDDPSFAARIGFVLLLASRLRHPNLLAVGEPREEGGVVYSAVETLPPVTFGDGLRQGRRLTPDTAVGLALQAADGLAFLHRHGLVHRRVNPNTLAVASGVVVKVTDWGSVHTAVPAPPDPAHPERRVSAADYIAPELLNAPLARDPRVDVYGLGCTLLAMLTGHPPARGRGGNGPLSRTGPTSRGGANGAAVPPALSVILARATAHSPSARFADVGEFATALRQWQQSRPPAVTADDREAYRVLAAEYARAAATCWWPAAAVVAASAAVAAGLFDQSAPTAAGVLIGGLTATVSGVGGRIASADTELGGLIRRAVRAVAPAAAVTLGLTLILGVAVAATTLPSQVFVLLLAAGGVGLTAGLGYATLRDKADRRRNELAARGHALLKALRLRGADEGTIRLFVKSAAGCWVPFARRLFGGDEAERMRVTANPRPAQGWTEAVCDRLRTAERQQATDQTRAALLWLQRRRMAGKEVSSGADERARRVVDDLLTKAAGVERAGDTPGLDDSYRAAYGWYPEAGQKAAATPAHTVRRAADLLFHPLGRVAVAALLLTFGFLWVAQNGCPPPHAEGQPAAAVPPLLALVLSPETAAHPLAVGWLPVWATRPFASVNPLIAAVGLLASIRWRSRWVAAGAWIGAAVAVLAVPVGLTVKPLGPLGPSHVALLLGAVVGGMIAVIGAGKKAPAGGPAEELSSVTPTSFG